MTGVVEKKLFHVGDILSVVAQRNLSQKGMDGPRLLLSFMLGTDGALLPEELTHEECRCYLLEQFPQFDSSNMYDALKLLDLMLRGNVGISRNYIVDFWIKKLLRGNFGICCEENMHVSQFSEEARKRLAEK